MTFTLLALCSCPLTLRKPAAILWVESWRGPVTRNQKRPLVNSSQGTKILGLKDNKWILQKSMYAILEVDVSPAGLWHDWSFGRPFHSCQRIQISHLQQLWDNKTVAWRLLNTGLICYTARDSSCSKILADSMKRRRQGSRGLVQIRKLRLWKEIQIFLVWKILKSTSHLCVELLGFRMILSFLSNIYCMFSPSMAPHGILEKQRSKPYCPSLDISGLGQRC